MTAAATAGAVAGHHVGAAIDRAVTRTPSAPVGGGGGPPTLGQRWTAFATQPGVARGASFASGFVPIAGEAQDFAGAIYGVDIITGEQLAPWERGLSGALLLVPFVGAVSVRQGVRALNNVVQESSRRLLKAYRVVGEGEAKAIRRTGRIPNVDQFGNPKEVLLSPTKYTSSGQAEEALRVGKHDPRGPRPSPKYGVEADLEGVPLSRANLIEGGTDFEVGTYGSPRARRLFRLDE